MVDSICCIATTTQGLAWSVLVWSGQARLCQIDFISRLACRLCHVDGDFARLTSGFARVNQDCAKWNSVGGCVWVILPVWLWEGVEGVHSEAIIISRSSNFGGVKKCSRNDGTN